MQQAFAPHLMNLDIEGPTDNAHFIAIHGLTRLTNLNLGLQNAELQPDSLAATGFSALQNLRELQLQAVGATANVGYLNLSTLASLTYLGLHDFQGSLAAAAQLLHLEDLTVTTPMDRPSAETLEAMRGLTELTSLMFVDGILSEELNALKTLPRLKVLECTTLRRESLTGFAGGPVGYYQALGGLTRLSRLQMSYCGYVSSQLLKHLPMSHLVWCTTNALPSKMNVPYVKGYCCASWLHQARCYR